MANKSEYCEKDKLFIRRFVYDVLAYTLTKCEFPESKLPNIDCEENVYRKAKFVKIAGASALRIALILRENCRDIFMKRQSRFESNSEEVSLCLGALTVRVHLSRKKMAQSGVEVILALCNEMFLFLHHEDIHIDHLEVMKSVSSDILLIIGSDRNISETIEGYFDEFDNIKKYTKWITNFIQKYAVPYGSRVDVPYLFCERIRNQFLKLKKASPPGTRAIDIVKVHLGYIPRNIISSITAEESELLSEHLVTASGSAISDDRKSQDPTKSPCTSGTGDQAESNLRGRKSTGSKDIPKETAIGEQNIDNPPVVGIEEDFGQMSLVDEENSQASHGAIPKRKFAKAVRKVNNVSFSQYQKFYE